MAALHSPMTQLETAGKTLHHRWETTKSAWDDPVSRIFESDYLTLIEAQAQATLKEIWSFDIRGCGEGEKVVG